MGGGKVPGLARMAAPTIVFTTLLLIGGLVVAALVFRPWPFSTDTAKYGRVALPNTPAEILANPLDDPTRFSNEARLELDEGEVTVFYARARAEGRETLNRRFSPETFDLSVQPAGGGEPLEIEDRGTTVGANEGLTETVTIGEMDVPATGDYLVTVGSRGTADDTGHITFGDEKLGATFGRAKDVLLTPWAGIWLVALLVSGFFAFRGVQGSWIGAAFGGKGPAMPEIEVPQAAQTPEAKAQTAAAMEQATKAQLEYLDKQLAEGQITQEQYDAAKAGILGSS